MADMLNSWAEKWGAAADEEMSSSTLFTLPLKQKASAISLGGIPLKEDEAAADSCHHV